jgi:TonB-linked SusC/RagA family outer membrane protein
MKFYAHRARTGKGSLCAKLFMIMRLTAIILVITALHVSAKTFSQNITISGRHISLKQVLKQISKQTGYELVYDPHLIRDAPDLTLNIRNGQLTDVLTLSLQATGLTFLVTDNTIIIKKKPEPVKEEETPLALPPDITGTVRDSASSEPIAGVTVTVKGTRIVTQTDRNGAFSIAAARGQVLIFSFVGFREQAVTVGDKMSLSISLGAAPQALSDAVIVGYGSQSKRTLATATSRVTAADFKNAVVNTVDQALQGRATGVQVTASSGEPGASAVVRIRGSNSLSGNNEPLYVIDGFPMPAYREAGATFSGTYQQNGLYGINPTDIESMEVLKDASATAIYGSRGANGVVLITTKAGKRGEGKLELINRISTGKIAHPFEMMNARQYAEVANDYYTLTNRPKPFGNLDSALANTDWVDAVTRSSMREDASINVSGGTAKSSYYVSGNYLYEKGTLIASDNKRGSLRVNLNNEINKWYTLKSQVSLTRQNARRAITASRRFPASGGLMDAFRAPPTLALDYLGTNSLGVPGYSGNWFSNIYNELTTKKDFTKNDYSVVNLENVFKIIPDLQLVVSLGGNQNLTRRQVFLPASTGVAHNANGQGSNSTANTYSYNVNAYLAYDKSFTEDHKLNLTLGGEYNTQTLEQLGASSSGYTVPSFGIDNIGGAATQSINSYKEKRVIQSGFFRGNYTYKGKYVLNTSLRLDGASPFAANKKYGLFPAVAAAWNLDQESFMEDLKVFSNTKLRVSYGETGSQAINPYSSLAQYNLNYVEFGATSTISPALFPVTLGNANLSWERTRQFDAGLDVSLFKKRVTLNVDYYNKKTIKLLQSRVLPTQSGYATIIDNYGTMRNQGIELGLQVDVIRQKDLQVSTRINISHNKTTLLDLGTLKAPTYVSISGGLAQGVMGILAPGQEIGRFFGYKAIGLAQTTDFKPDGVTPNFPFFGAAANTTPGSWKFEDYDKSGVIDAKDRQVLGKSTPDFTYGWTTDISYKNFGLSAFFTGSVGNDILNITRFYTNSGMIDFSNVSFNQTEDWYQHRWTAAKPGNDPRYPGVQKTYTLSDINSSMIEDGSYFRLKTLTLSYSLPNMKVIKNARLFVTGTNIFTITKYSGFDPEVSSFDQSLLQQGVDYGAYPSQRSYTVGVSCNF